MEHLTVAGELYRSQRYVLAHYVSGLAVECIFYAFGASPRKDHNLYELAKSAKFSDISPRRYAEIDAALAVVITRWLNSHRYRSEAELRALLREKKLDRGFPRGTDFLKENSRRILEAATMIIKLGVAHAQKNR